VPWNKGKLVGQKAPLKPKEVWAIRARLQMENRARELSLFDLGIDSKLTGNFGPIPAVVIDVIHPGPFASQTTRAQSLPSGRSRRASAPAWGRS
jgi:hypothetical protein